MSGELSFHGVAVANAESLAIDGAAGFSKVVVSIGHRPRARAS